jgi:hypothetical protein
LKNIMGDLRDHFSARSFTRRSAMWLIGAAVLFAPASAFAQDASAPKSTNGAASW